MKRLCLQLTHVGRQTTHTTFDLMSSWCRESSESVRQLDIHLTRSIDLALMGIDKERPQTTSWVYWVTNQGDEACLKCMHVVTCCSGGVNIVSICLRDAQALLFVGIAPQWLLQCQFATD